ncbi:MAG TPA: hypothetical protein VN025_19405 [Candidatus Dormibacteraeota bacterium]|jgi:hypothetical protein|nr:hypothetical protein [Candidatus Dormibacteraeota bacterium]
MKRLVLAVIATFGSAGIAAAQDGAFNLNTPAGTNAHRFTAAGEGIQLVSSVTGDTVAVPTPSANPNPQPEPRFYFGNNDDYRFQLGIGYEYVRFRSTPFNSNLNGLHTSLSYYLNDWFAVEGSIVSAFGTKVFSDERSKYLLYTGGGRIAWRDPKRKYEPWMHALVGGLHMIPQTAVGGKNGFALQVGAGVDLRYNARLSFRVNGDYVRSQLYSQSQNNFQFGGGAVIHF